MRLRYLFGFHHPDHPASGWVLERDSFESLLSTYLDYTDHPMEGYRYLMILEINRVRQLLTLATDPTLATVPHAV